MNYTKSYDKEESFVVLFDVKGAFIGYYRFCSHQFYEDYVTKNIMQGGNGDLNTSMPKMTLLY